MLRLFSIASMLALTASTAFAQEVSTVQVVLSKGVVIHDMMGDLPVDIQVTYNLDGTSALRIVGPRGKGRDISGAWRVDGDKVCTSNQLNPIESCVVIPPDKKPGDSFVVVTPRGEITLTINR